MSDETVRTYLAENPRMIGVLFALLLPLSQAGAVRAGGGTGTPGP